MIRALLVFMALMFSVPMARAALVVDNLNDRYFLIPEAQYVEDTFSEWTIQDVIDNDASLPWQSTPKKVLGLGFRNSTWWLKVDLQNVGQRTMWWLVFGYPLLNDVSLYPVSNGKPGPRMTGGTARPSPNESVRSHQILFPLTLAKGEHLGLYIRIKSQSSLLIPLTLQSTQPLLEEGLAHLGWLGVFYGFLLALLIYHMVVLISFPDRAYALLIGIIACLITFNLIMQGIADRYLFASADNFPLKLIPATMSASCFLLQVLTRKFLSTKTEFPRADHWLFMAQSVSLFGVFVSILGDYHTGILVTAPTIPVLILSGIIVSFRARHAGYRPATLFFAGWTGLVIGCVVYALRALGVVSDNAFTENSFPLALMTYVLLVAFSLTDRLRLLDEASTASTRELALQTDRLNLQLQGEVDSRTKELADETAQLATARHALASHQRRLASGVMSAGIAHEINNPNNFISGGIQVFMKRLDDFSSLIDDLLDDDAPDYIRLEIRNRIARMRSEAYRVSENSNEVSNIVTRFRTISNGDESDVLITDVASRIESAIQSARAGLSSQVQIRSEFPVRPEVKCRPMDAVHAFLDVVRNIAAQARPGTELRADSKIQSGRLLIALRCNHPFRLSRDTQERADLLMKNQRGEFKVVNERTVVFHFPLKPDSLAPPPA